LLKIGNNKIIFDYIMGASILPVTVHNGKVLLLFGKERNIDSNPGWSDFGGGTDKGETFMETATREASEELTGFIGSAADIRKLLNKYGNVHVDYKSDNGYGTYRCHIFPMTYDEQLPFYYNNNQRFLQKRLDPAVIRDTKIFEKTQIQWFDINELKRRRHEFRDFYRNIIDLILEKKSEIIALANKSLTKRSLKTRRSSSKAVKGGKKWGGTRRRRRTNK
jgi:8-oxo-dGTP pyrophosphatase MutT (NUDIX family)